MRIRITTIALIVLVTLASCQLVEFEEIPADVTPTFEVRPDVTEIPVEEIAEAKKNNVTSGTETVTSDLYVCPNSGNLYVRIGAGKGNASAGYLAPGTPVTLVTSEPESVTSDGATWVKIVEGWVNKKYLCKDGVHR